MHKIEAPTLEEAYTKASELFECSVAELHCKVVQYPSRGIFGFLKKNAIIAVEYKESAVESESIVQETAAQIVTVVKEEYQHQESRASFEENEEAIVSQEIEKESLVPDKLALLIENQLKELFTHACYDIDVIEVDIRDNMALIFIDGEDAALLIGKEGYRYNALSYMIFSWLHTKYKLFVKLEIAAFLTNQQEMIRNYIEPLIEDIEMKGYGKTRFLDGVLVQIALEELRTAFPDKYVAVKTAKNGKKFVVVNDFYNKDNA